MVNEKWAAAFNRWLDDYTKDPSAYEQIAETAIRHLREQLDGREPTYGESSAAAFAAYLEAVA